MRLLPKIVLAVLAPVLVGAVGALVVLSLRLDMERRAALSVADSQLQLRAVELAAQLRMRREALRLLAASPLLLQDDVPAIDLALLAWSGGSSLFSGILFQGLDTDGRPRGLGAATAPNVAIDANELAALRAGRDDSLLRPQAGAAGPELQQLVAVRDVQGTLTGVLAGSMPLAAVMAPAPQQPPSPGVRWLLLDAQLQPLAEPPAAGGGAVLAEAAAAAPAARASTAVPTSASAPTAASTAAEAASAVSASSVPASQVTAAALAQALASAPLAATPLFAGSTQLAQAQDILADGLHYRVLSAPVMGTGWRLAYAQPAAVFDAPLRGPIQRVVLLLAPVLGLSFLGAWWVQRQVARPLARLRDAHARVQSGDLQVRAPERGHGELADLERSFNRMAEGLAAAEHKFRRIFEAFPHPVVLSRLDDGRYLDVNPAFEERSGHAREHAIGRTGFELGLVDSADSWAQQVQALQQQGRLDAMPMSVATANGRRYWALYSSRLIELHGESVVLTVAADITPIKEAEERLRRSEESFTALFESAPLPLCYTLLDGGRNASTWNRAWYRAFGYTREQAHGRSGNDFGMWVDSADRERYQERIEEGGGRCEPFAVQLRHRDGSVHWYEVSGEVIDTSEGKMLMGAYVDVTQERNAVIASQAAQAELRELNETLEARVAARTQELGQVQAGLLQAEKLASLGALVAGVAHELNTPIGNAVMMASTLADHQREFEAAMSGGLRKSTLDNYLGSTREAAQVLERNLRRAAELVGSFKQLAVDQASYQRRRFELREVLQEVLLALSPTLRRSSVSLRHDVPNGLVLDSYPGPLGQVLVNLITNALLHAFDEGAADAVIEVQAGRGGETGSRIRLRLRDNGRGIAEADLGRIFDPFFTTRLGQGGSGLGLHIVYKLVTDLLGGRIEVRSHVGSGTEFVIDLPDCAPKV